MLTAPLGPGLRWQRVGPRLEQGAIDEFGDLLGFDAPIHVDPDYARRTVFASTIVQGMLLVAPVEAWLGELLGESAWTHRGRLEAKLLSPALPGEQGSFTLVSVAVRPGETMSFDFSVECAGRTVAVGSAALRA